jgi:hypothetical protein
MHDVSINSGTFAGAAWGRWLAALKKIHGIVPAPQSVARTHDAVTAKIDAAASGMAARLVASLADWVPREPNDLDGGTPPAELEDTHGAWLGEITFGMLLDGSGRGAHAARLLGAMPCPAAKAARGSADYKSFVRMLERTLVRAESVDDISRAYERALGVAELLKQTQHLGAGAMVAPLAAPLSTQSSMNPSARPCHRGGAATTAAALSVAMAPGGW